MTQEESGSSEVSQSTWSLESATRTKTDERGVLVAQTHPAFWTLIGPYGGWSAAVILRAVIEASDSDFVPVAMTTHFPGAIQEGAVDVSLDLTRQNRGTAFWRGSLLQQEKCAIDAQIVMARRRESVSIVDSVKPETVAPDSLTTTEFPGIPWTTTYDCRFVTSPPGIDSGSFRSVFWVRLRHDEPMTFPALVSLCDACVPRIFFRSDQFFPASTISMNVQIHADHESLNALGHEFLLVEANGNLASKGFFDQHLSVWTSSGDLLATSEQLFWYKNETS